MAFSFSGSSNRTRLIFTAGSSTGTGSGTSAGSATTANTLSQFASTTSAPTIDPSIIDPGKAYEAYST